MDTVVIITLLGGLVGGILMGWTLYLLGVELQLPPYQRSGVLHRPAKPLLPDGTPLQLQHQSLQFLESAEFWLASSYRYPCNHPGFPLTDVQVVAEAIAVATGKDVQTVRATAKKHAKRGW